MGNLKARPDERVEEKCNWVKFVIIRIFSVISELV